MGKSIEELTKGLDELREGIKELSGDPTGVSIGKKTEELVMTPEQFKAFQEGINEKFSKMNSKDVELKKEKESKKLSEVQKGAQIIKDLANGRMKSAKIVKTMTEGTTTAGGFLVNDHLYNKIWAAGEKHSVIEKVTQIPVPENVGDMLLPARTANITGYLKTETGAGTESGATIGQVNMPFYEVIAIVPFSKVLLQDNMNGEGLITLLGMWANEALRTKIAQQIFQGSGSSQFRGIKNANSTYNIQDLNSHTIGGNAGKDIVPDDLLDADIARPAALQEDPFQFASSKTMWSYLKRSKDGEGRYYYPPVGGIFEPHGYQTFLESYATDGVGSGAIIAYGGDFKQVYMGMKESLRLDYSDTATLSTAGNMWEKDFAAIKVVMNIGIAIMNGDCFTKLVTE